MNKSQKLLSVLQFALLLMIVAALVWSLFNPYATVALIPLVVVSIYYLLWYIFTKMVPFFDTKNGYYVVVAAVILPIITLALASDDVVKYSIQMLNIIRG